MRTSLACAVLALAACSLAADDEPSRPDARVRADASIIDAAPFPPDAFCGAPDASVMQQRIDEAFFTCGWPSEGGILCVDITIASSGLATAVDPSDQGDPLDPAYLDCMRENLLGDCLAYRAGSTESHCAAGF